MADANYSNVVLLLPMNGADGGTAFTDYSPSLKTVTRYGDAHTETDQSKFYGSSGAFDGNGDYLTTPIGSWLTFADDFTIEAWVRIASGTSNQWLMDARSSATAQNFVVGFAYNAGKWYPDMYWPSSHKIGTSVYVVADTWAHVAYVRSGTTVSFYVDGVKDASTFTLSGSFAPTGTTLNLMRALDPVYFKGYVQDLRITNGVARYTENFTPPGKLCGAISGAVYDAAGDPAQRTVIAVPRTYPCNVAWSTQSSAVDGTYSLTVPDVECSRIVLADETTLYNDLIDRVLPG